MPALAGANLIYGLGMIESGMTFDFGQLVMDAKLYESLVITADRLTLALDDFRSLIAEWRKGGVKIGL